MKRNIFIFLILFCAASFPPHLRAACSNPAPSSTAGPVEKHVYKTYKDEEGEEKQLNIALVRPVDKLSLKKRPLVVGVHGGGFINFCPLQPCYLKYSENVLTQYFVPQGWATASVQYRLTLPVELKSLSVSDETVREAHYKSVQDVRQSLRFIFENAEKLGVDTENVFLAGTSAGAITVLHAAYMDNEEAPKDLLGKFGPLEKRVQLKGVISLSGAIYDLSYLGSGERVPLMLVHGVEDFIVPAEKGFYLGLKQLTPVYGGRAIFEEARKKDIPAKGYFYEFGHSIPSRFRSEIFNNAVGFIRTNLECRENAELKK